MGELEFFLYKVPSEVGDWLAVFEGNELVYLDSYNQGKKSLDSQLEKFLHQHYNFHIGKYQPAKWTKGNFWTKKHKIKLQGTEFQMKVWLELLKIPRGTCVTYSDIAKKIKKPKAVRAVGTAIGQNPVCVWIPCHRVIAKSGNIFKYRGGTETKIGLLKKEGALAISKS